MSEEGKIEELTKSLKIYIQTNIELFKLEATERTAVIGASLSSLLLIGFSLFLCILFLSISVGLLLATIFDDYFLGFGLVALFYLLVTFILIIGRHKFIERPICDKIIRRILKK